MYLDHIVFFKSVGRSASKLCKPIKKELDVDQTGYFIASYGGNLHFGLTVTTFQGNMPHHLNANSFALLPLVFGKKCENKFRLDTHKIPFVLFMLQHCGCL